MTAQDKAFEIIKRIRRAKELSERDAVAIALITVDEINSALWDLEPREEEDLWLYRELKAKIPYYKEVESVLKRL